MDFKGKGWCLKCNCRLNSWYWLYLPSKHIGNYYQMSRINNAKLLIPFVKHILITMSYWVLVVKVYWNLLCWSFSVVDDSGLDGMDAASSGNLSFYSLTYLDSLVVQICLSFCLIWITLVLHKVLVQCESSSHIDDPFYSDYLHWLFEGLCSASMSGKQAPKWHCFASQIVYLHFTKLLNTLHTLVICFKRRCPLHGIPIPYVVYILLCFYHFISLLCSS